MIISRRAEVQFVGGSQCRRALSRRKRPSGSGLSAGGDWMRVGRSAERWYVNA
jgi:hypothetical protein